MSYVNLPGIRLDLCQVYQCVRGGQNCAERKAAAVKRPTTPKFWLRDLQLGEEELFARDPVSVQFEG